MKSIQIEKRKRYSLALSIKRSLHKTQLKSTTFRMGSKSTQLLLEALTCGTATAVAKRNNPTVLLIIPIMITLFFSIFISDANYYTTSLGLLPFHIPLVFPSTDIHPEVIWYNMDIQALQNHLHRRDLQQSYKMLYCLS